MRGRGGDMMDINFDYMFTTKEVEAFLKNGFNELIRLQCYSCKKEIGNFYFHRVDTLTRKRAYTTCLECETMFRKQNLGYASGIIYLDGIINIPMLHTWGYESGEGI
jgi:hypothetical protein